MKLTLRAYQKAINTGYHARISVISVLFRRKRHREIVEIGGTSALTVLNCEFLCCLRCLETNIYAGRSWSWSEDEVTWVFVHKRSLNTSFHMSRKHNCLLTHLTSSCPLLMPSACITDSNLSPSWSLQHRNKPSYMFHIP